jgi:hypothetical protein
MKQALAYHQRPITIGTACTPAPRGYTFPSGSLAMLYYDTQERAQRVLETGAMAAQYIALVAACSAVTRKGQAL